jgi:hypothetical protein
VKSFKRFFSEKTILNLIENITLEGVGTLKCMADSGNSAYNVIDGRELRIEGDTLHFISTDANTPLAKQIVDTITIHIGSGVNEERPIVAFNLEFKGKKYNNVKFSVADRSKNETPVLLGREFLKTLDALIKIGA